MISTINVYTFGDALMYVTSAALVLAALFIVVGVKYEEWLEQRELKRQLKEVEDELIDNLAAQKFIKRG